MPYTTNQLITGAYYVSGVVSREFETVSGGQIADGLQFLNDILTEKRVDEGMIPYETTYTFIAEVGKEKYWIPGLIEPDTCVFYLQSVRYPMIITKRNQYFGAPRVENINTLPYLCYFERGTGGGTLYLYFQPNQDYQFEIHGTFDLPTVSLGQNLLNTNTIADLGVPTFYYSMIGDIDSTTFGITSLAPGQLVVSTGQGTSIMNYDLEGTYSNVGALINYINSGIIPGVMAELVVNDFVLYSATEPAVSFSVSSTGYPGGTSFIGNVEAATTRNIGTYNNGNLGVGAVLFAILPGALVVDGYTANVNDRILVINQTDPVQNGSYIVNTAGNSFTPWFMTRTTNYDLPSQIQEGNLFTVINGATYGNLSFVQTADVSAIGFSPILFMLFSAITFSNFSTIQQSNYQVYNPGGFDEFYLTYLRYALAERICSEYAYDIPMGVTKQLNKYESWIKSKSRVIDLTLEKVSTLGKRNYVGWCWVNLGRGFISNS